VRVDKLKKDYDLDVEWKPFEIHPELPPQGVPRRALPSNEYMRAAAENVRRLAEDCGLTLRQPSVIANSRLALAAAEFARDHGRFEDFHRRVFQAYYQEDQNIGDLSVLQQIGSEVGLDPAELAKALAEQRYEPLFIKIRREIEEYGITGAPTFLFDGKYRIVGAQSYDVFQQTLARIEELKRREDRP